MSSACRSALAVVVALCVAGVAQARELRVCSDPDNLPLSNQDGTGFENKIARLVADDMGAELSYEWLPMRRGFVRNTLGAGKCDVIAGIPSSFELAMTTRPYYRSSYVFVARRNRRLNVTSLDDPRLHVDHLVDARQRAHLHRQHLRAERALHLRGRTDHRGRHRRVLLPLRDERNRAPRCTHLAGCEPG